MCFTSAFDALIDQGDIDGYVTLDFLSSIQLGEGKLSLAVTNLLNNQYIPASSQVLTGLLESRRAAAPGRAITLGYSVRF